MKLVAALALVCLPLGSCLVAAGAGAGYLINREILKDRSHTAEVQDDVEPVYSIARETLGILIDPGTEVVTKSSPRTASGKVDGSDVIVTVEAFDLDRTTIRVKAETLLGNDDSDTAEHVLDEILRRLSAERERKR